MAKWPSPVLRTEEVPIQRSCILNWNSPEIGGFWLERRMRRWPVFLEEEGRLRLCPPPPDSYREPNEYLCVRVETRSRGKDRWINLKDCGLHGLFKYASLGWRMWPSSCPFSWQTQSLYSTPFVAHFVCILKCTKPWSDQPSILTYNHHPATTIAAPPTHDEIGYGRSVVIPSNVRQWNRELTNFAKSFFPEPGQRHQLGSYGESSVSCQQRHIQRHDETLHPIFTIEFYNGYYTLKMCYTAATSTSFGQRRRELHSRSRRSWWAFLCLLIPHHCRQTQCDSPQRVLHTYNRIYFIRHNRITYCRSQFTFLLLWYGVRYGRV